MKNFEKEKKNYSKRLRRLNKDILDAYVTGELDEQINYVGDDNSDDSDFENNESDYDSLDDYISEELDLQHIEDRTDLNNETNVNNTNIMENSTNLNYNLITENLTIKEKLNNLNDKSKYFKISEQTLNYDEKDWEDILGINKFHYFDTNISNSKDYFSEKLFENSKYSCFELMLILLSIKTRRKINEKLINLFIKIFFKIFNLNKKFPKNFKNIIKELKINNMVKIPICVNCNHIFKQNYLNCITLNDNNLICPICKNVKFKILNKKIQPIDFIYHYPLVPQIIDKFNTNKEFKNDIDYFNYKGKGSYHFLDSKFCKKILEDFQKKRKENSILVIFSLHQDGISFHKKGINKKVDCSSIEILTLSKNKNPILINQLQQNNQNMNLTNLILTKEIEILQKGISFVDSYNNIIQLYGNLLFIKGDIPQVHQSLNLRGEKACCSKCEANSNKVTYEINKNNEKKIRNKRNWNVNPSQKRNVWSSLNYLLNNKFESSDDNYYTSTRNLNGLSPFIYLYDYNGFDYFIHTIGCEKLHNQSGILGKVIKEIPKKKIKIIDKIILGTITTKDNLNQIKVLSQIKNMNSSEIIQIYNSYGRLWFRMIPPTPLIKNIINLFDIKYFLNKYLYNYNENNDMEIKKILENEKNVLLEIFKKKKIFTSKMHQEVSHLLEDVKEIGPLDTTSCQLNENYFTLFKKWRNGCCNSFDEINVGFLMYEFLENYLNNNLISNKHDDNFLSLLQYIGLSIKSSLFIEKKNKFTVLNEKNNIFCLTKYIKKYKKDFNYIKNDKILDSELKKFIQKKFQINENDEINNIMILNTVKKEDTLYSTLLNDEKKKKRDCYINYEFEKFSGIKEIIFFKFKQEFLTVLLIKKFKFFGYFVDTNIPIISKDPEENFEVIELNDKIKKIGLIKIKKFFKKEFIISNKNNENYIPQVIEEKN